MITIRPAAYEDAKSLGVVHDQAWREAYWGVLPDAAVLDETADERGQAWKARLSRVASDMEALDEGVFVAEADDDLVVGFSWSGPTRGSGSPWEGEIYMLYVLQDLQGVGIGRGLFARALAHLMERGFFEVGVWALEANTRGRAFYESMGGKMVAKGVEIVRGGRADVVGYAWDDAEAIRRVLGAL